MYKMWFNTEEDAVKVQNILFMCGYKWCINSMCGALTNTRIIIIDYSKKILYADCKITTYEEFLYNYTDCKEMELTIDFKPALEKIVIDGKYYSKEEILKTIKPLQK